jgi:glycosyltransferase involved in cell wall biosynthesis
MKLTFYPMMGVNPYTGYGRMALGIAKGLREIGVEPLLYPEDHAPALIIGYAQAFEASHIRPLRRWVYLMQESDQPAEELILALNQHAERLFVPAPPFIETFQRHGLTIPVDWIPLGVDLFPVPPLPATQAPHEPFTFLTYSYGEYRKGADVVVKAYMAAFGADPRYRLLIKARDGFQLGWLSLIQHPQIALVTGYQTEEDWLSLMQSADCFVFPSRAEGWGMPPREATLLGIPTIGTQWLGMWDLDRWGIPVPVTEFRKCDFHLNPFNSSNGHWAEPSVDLVAEHMQWVVDHYAAARQIATQGRAYLLQNFTWRHTAHKIAAFLG